MDRRPKGDQRRLRVLSGRVEESDAGIYVGQCQHIIVRNSTAKFNVAGIEIENCYYADVYNNLATRNTGGILVFDLPNLPQQGGHHVRVFDNKSIDNDTKNFAPEGNIVGFVPTGTGMSIMANSDVEVFNNEFSGNGTVNLSIRGFLPYGDIKTEADPNYYPYPRKLHIHNNKFGTGGDKPMGVRGELYAAAAGGAPIPDIMWDGIKDEAAIAKGTVPANANIFIHDNGDADFINLDLARYMEDPKSAKPSRDIKAHKGSLPPIAPVKIPQDS
jgi:parallel beta-helix repeat protein